MEDKDEAAALQLAAQVHFRLDQPEACVQAVEQLRAQGQVGVSAQQRGLSALCR